MQNPNVGKFNLRKSKSDFTCLEKVLQGQVSGEGVKRTPAYETPLTKTELEKWRKEFWGILKVYN